MERYSAKQTAANYSNLNLSNGSLDASGGHFQITFSLASEDSSHPNEKVSNLQITQFTYQIIHFRTASLIGQWLGGGSNHADIDWQMRNLSHAHGSPYWLNFSSCVVFIDRSPCAVSHYVYHKQYILFFMYRTDVKR